MNDGLREKILAYNRQLAAHREKAEDLQVLVDGMLRLPYGQTKKLLTDEVVAVLEKYGWR
ncbi:MAG: hypothetical protein IJD81_09165 [Oscillospiraceae bacterium]|nr:hypothetical protein [Oscillospiraceae bacterium]